MQKMIDGDTDKRNTWAKVLQRRGEIGYPYIFFNGNANSNCPDVYKDKNHKINASNLCTEIVEKGLLVGPTIKHIVAEAGDE